ncbi:conserved hypothetical protein [Altererythrobacter sp. B11]|uniref:YdcF family protein n=1 Tax=Altererythrobacter sp. B11 TaxID=2060312 RepID=UPI000DC6EDAA|nr:YdcF family protein [Altererythrobacter sp. B11]BBC71816.1 conserved hypothetical protein [Altererythrobacter sp. B11]
MIRRAFSLLVVLWMLGFLWFAIALPQPAGPEKTDAIVVPTGSGGRIPRGLSLLNAGEAGKMLVTGVDHDVKPREFAAEYDVSSRLMECCVTLGFVALDTRGNARETADWVAQEKVHSIRLVTADWHMRRAALELQSTLPADVTVLRDAVPSSPSLATLFLEYHKLLASWLAQAWPG